MTARIVVVGSLNIDFVVRVPRLPAAGETVLGAGDLQTIPGGKGANQAYGAGRLGAEVAMVGRVGEDPFGDQLTNSLEDAGVDIRHVSRDPNAATGAALIEVDEKGQNSIVVSAGANGHVTPDDVRRAEDTIRAAAVMLIQLEIPLAAVLEAARVGRRHGVTTVLNPAPARPLTADLLSLIDVLIPNETEAALLSGQDVAEESAIEPAAAALQESGVKTVILTRGSAGAALITEQDISHVSPFVVEPVDTTAAGDAFVSGFAVALAEGKTLLDAVRYGNAAGALATTRAGAQPSLPGRDEVERLLAGDSPCAIF